MEKNDKVPELSKNEFDEFVSDGIVLIDFFAEWCMPCLMMAPVVDELADKFIGKVKFGKVNIDDNQILAQKLGISSIPNFILFKDGKKVGQFIGGMPEEEFEEKLKSMLNK
jgi:thioredoxin 1